jgi:hypothetical protein
MVRLSIVTADTVSARGAAPALATKFLVVGIVPIINILASTGATVLTWPTPFERAAGSRISWFTRRSAIALSAPSVIWGPRLAAL